MKWSNPIEHTMAACKMTARRIHGRRYVQIRPKTILKRRRARLMRVYVGLFVYIIRYDYTAGLHYNVHRLRAHRRPRLMWGLSLALLVFLACLPCVGYTGDTVIHNGHGASSFAAAAAGIVGLSKGDIQLQSDLVCA